MSIEDYISKKNAFDQATAARTALIGRTHEIVKAMAQSPSLFHFSNCSGGFPPEVIMNRAAPSVSASEWPTADHIQSLLVKWHEAKFAAESAWQRLTVDQRKALTPPV